MTQVKGFSPVSKAKRLNNKRKDTRALMSFEVFRPTELSFTEATLWFNNSDGRKAYTWNRLAVMSCCGRLRLPGPFDLVSVGSGAVPGGGVAEKYYFRQINVYIGRWK